MPNITTKIASGDLLVGISTKAKLRLHLALMSSVIETLLEAPSDKLLEPELYKLLFDLSDDIKELLGETNNDDTQAPTTP